MRHHSVKRGFLLISLATFVALWLGTAPAPAQSSGAPGKQLTVERVYGRPSLSGTFTQGLEWAPDGKRLSYFHRSGEGKDAKTELWVMDALTGERHTLVDAEKLGTLLEPPKGPPSQATGLGRAEYMGISDFADLVLDWRDHGCHEHPCPGMVLPGAA